MDKFETLGSCPACQCRTIAPSSDLADYIGLRDPFTVDECDNCSMRWLSPMPSPLQYVEMYRKAYFGLEGGENTPFEEDHWAATYALPSENTRRQSVEFGAARDQHITHFLDKARQLNHGIPGRLLEVGSGGGEFLLAARSAGWEVAAIEPSESGARTLVNEGVDVHNGMLESAPDGGKFDVIYLSHVFEHLPDPNLALQTLYEKLKGGGHLLVVVPNQFDSAVDRISRTLRNFSAPTIYSIHHPFFYSPGVLSSLVSRHGYEVCDLRTHHAWEFANNSTGIALRQVDWMADRLRSSGRVVELTARRT